MSTKNVITGSQVTLTIDDKDGNPVDYTPQVLSVTLTSTADRQAVDLLSGGVYYRTIVRDYELTMTGLADWGHTDSVCDALEQAFTDDPDEPLEFELVAINDPNTITVVGKVFPKVPTAGGEGATVTQFDVSLTGDVNSALSITSAVTPS
jgi:hypothetical protein